MAVVPQVQGRDVLARRLAQLGVPALPELGVTEEAGMTSTTIGGVNVGSGSSTFTFHRAQPGRQPPGFCEKNNLEHAWVAPEFVLAPGPTLRSCVNCGKVQRLIPAEWVDEETA